LERPENSDLLAGKSKVKRERVDESVKLVVEREKVPFNICN
jgi:hypothetical protein